jgi:hypothetical protein
MLRSLLVLLVPIVAASEDSVTWESNGVLTVVTCVMYVILAVVQVMVLSCVLHKERCKIALIAAGFTKTRAELFDLGGVEDRVAGKEKENHKRLIDDLVDCSVEYSARDVFGKSYKISAENLQVPRSWFEEWKSESNEVITSIIYSPNDVYSFMLEREFQNLKFLTTKTISAFFAIWLFNIFAASIEMLIFCKNNQLNVCESSDTRFGFVVGVAFLCSLLVFAIIWLGPYLKRRLIGRTKEESQIGVLISEQNNMQASPMIADRNALELSTPQREGIRLRT